VPARRAFTWAVLAITALATAAITLPGPGAPAGRTLGLFAVAFAGWACLLVLVVRGAGPSRRVVLAVAVAGAALAVIQPPVGSTDVSSYAVYGRMVAAHHVSPYAHVPAEFPDDPWLPRMATFWHHTGSVYGPAFTAVSAAGMAWAGRSWVKGRLFFQGLELAAFLVMLLLIDRVTRGDPGALVFAGLNPLLVASVVNGGHNDLLVGVGVLAGAALLMTGEDRRPDDRTLALVGIVVALGALVKIVGLLALGAVVVWLWRRRGRRAAAIVAVSGGATVVVAYLLAGGRVAVRALLDATDRALLPSFWGYPRRWLTHRFVTEGVASPAAAADHLVGRLALLTMALVAAVVVLTRMGRRTPVTAMGGALFAFLLAGAYLMAWYPAWILPVLALRWRSRLALAAAAFSSVLMLAHVELPSRLHGTTLTVERFLHDTAVPVAALALIAAVLVDAVLWRARGGGRTGRATEPSVSEAAAGYTSVTSR
jgi:hypothetical protein